LPTGLAGLKYPQPWLWTAEAAKLRAQGANLVDFGAGEPHFPTPRHIKDAAIEAIEANFTRYTVVRGFRTCARRLWSGMRATSARTTRLDEAIFTTGGKLALFNAIQVLVDHGDEVILPVPYWVSFKDIIQYAGGKVVFVETSEREELPHHGDAIEGDYAEDEGDHSELAVEPLGRGGVAGGPGADCAPGARARDLSAAGRVLCVPELCGQAGERGIVYLGKEHVVVLGSLSKTYAMTGWRAGFALGPKAVVAMSKLQSQSTSNATSFVQKAAIAALTGSQECVLRDAGGVYLKLRDYMLAGLRRFRA
jgi:aspartate aminotransferase